MVKPTVALFYLQRQVKSFALREKLAAVLGSFIGKTTIDGSSSLGFDYEEHYALRLKQDGFAELPYTLRDDVLDAIGNAVRNFKLYDYTNPGLGGFALGHVPDATHVANYNREDLVTVDAIMRIANDPCILNIVQDFLGATPTISNINMWWSFAGRSKAKDAQLFHRDVDDFKFCKLFIYLTDVGPDDGPHVYVKGSSSTNKLTKIRRYEDQEVTDAFGKENVINFVRPKGSVFLVDTYGFHKGTLPKANNRLLLQVQYSLMPIWIEDYHPQDIPANGYNKYINRLLIKS